MRSVSLGAILLLFWLAMSGHYTPFLVGVGVCCAAVCVWLAQKMDIVDAEGLPVAFFAGALSYWAWLWVEIFKSSVSVARVIWNPRLPISPTMTCVRAGQRTPVGIATYANSITLTPGTITTGVRGSILTVHALTADGASDVESGVMDHRVCKFEGPE